MPDDPRQRGLLEAADVAALRQALGDYTVEGVHDRVGLAGEAALGRGDLSGLRRCLADDPLSTLIRLFLLGEAVTESAATAALGTTALEPVLQRSGSEVRASVEIRPYGETDGERHSSWWVVSDFGADVRPGPLATDHVLGIGAAALTLAQATVRRPVDTALDVGTGCGVQALHLSGHAARVTATDLSSRALRFAATTAALNGLDWELRAGSLLDPVEGECFDLVVANPPFVVSPGWTGDDEGFDYRDGGLPGDGISRGLVQTLPSVLTEGGTAQLLANWVITADQEWTERLAGWISGGCDAWVWQREVAEPGEYVALWLRDAGETPGTPRWAARYERWLDWFDAAGVLAIGMGLVNLRRTGSDVPAVTCEDVRQAVQQPIGDQIDAWFGRARWLAEHDDRTLLSASPRRGDVLLNSDAAPGPAGWQTEARRLRQPGGMCWEIEVDDPIAALVCGCDGQTPLRDLLSVLAMSLGVPAEQVAAAALPVIRDLIGRGMLTP